MDVGMGSLDGATECGPELLRIVARQRAEQIVQRLHTQNSRLLYSYTLLKSPPRFDVENHALMVRSVAVQDGKKMTELCALAVTTGTGTRDLRRPLPSRGPGMPRCNGRSRAWTARPAGLALPLTTDSG
jgi:hypothetical protein